MKNIFYILLLLPTIIFAQYPSNSGQKITLGEQTTADGLVWRGRTSDTANLMTNKLDTSVYLVLDTMTEAMWLYRVTTTPKWNRVVDSLNNMQGTLSVAKGGTNAGAFTAGSVVFAGASGTSLTQDNTNLFWDNTNKRLGIGTASPTEKLHVVGNGLFTGNGSFGSYLGLNNRTTPIYSEQLTVGSFSVPKITLAQSGGYRWSTYIDATDAKYRIRYEDGSIDPLVIDRLGAITASSSVTATQGIFTSADALNINNTNGKIIGGGTTAGRFFFNNTDLSSYFVIYGSAYGGNQSNDITFVTGTTNIFNFNNDGNFGVGTASPTAKLHVKGSANASEFALKVDDSGSNNLLSVQNNGNVGIGTTSPTFKLDVNGTGRFSGDLKVDKGTPLFVLQASATDEFHGIEFRQGAGFDAFIKQLPQTGELKISSGRDATWGGNIKFYTDTGLRLTIASTGAATFSSSVTAKSLITSYSLDGDPVLATFTNANAGASAEATIYVRNGTINNDATFIQAIGTGFTTTGGFVQDGGVIGTGTTLSGGMSLIVRANADMRFYTNGHTNERMRIASNGNVGIGVAPSAMSAVSGIELLQGSQIASRILANVPQLYISSNIAGDSYAPTYKVNGYATQYRLQGYDGTHAWFIAPSGTAGAAITFTQAMTLGSNNGLSIGTTTAASANGLLVAGAATFSSSVNVTTTGTFGFQDYTTQTTQKVLVLNAEGVSGNYSPALFNIYTKPGTTVNGIASIIIKSKYGTDAESGNLFEFKGNGDFTIAGSNATKASGTAWINPSDVRLKTNIRPYNKGLAEVLKIQPKIWNFNEDSGFDQTKEHVSIIAQEIQDFMPEMISTYKGELNGKETELLRVDASDMTWLLVKAIQELQSQIDILKQEIINLKNK